MLFSLNLEKSDREVNEQIRSVIKTIFAAKGYVLCVLEGEDETEKKNQVTFNLANWHGENEPRRGQIALLTGVEKFDKGWRASNASPELFEKQTPKEQTENQKENQKLEQKYR